MNMVTNISFKQLCRNCLGTDNLHHIIQWISDDHEEFLTKSEFEVCCLIENWQEDVDYECEWCGHKGHVIMDVLVDREPLYQFERMVKRCKERDEWMITLNLIKDGEGGININPGGYFQFLLKNFFDAAIDKVFETVYQRPTSDYIEHKHGDFFVSLTGDPGWFGEKVELKVEKYWNNGFSREELTKALNTYAEAQGSNGQ